MQEVFATFATSRFVDREAVIQALRSLAGQLRAQRREVLEVYLFGSFATGKGCPRSDADILVVLRHGCDEAQSEIADQAARIFLDAPVPAEVFVFSSSRVAEGTRLGKGVAGAVGREGVRLA